MSVEMLNRLWRPVGAWGVVLNIILLPVLFTAMAWTGRGAQHLPNLIGLYTILAGLFGALFGIRQAGKHKALETHEALTLARMQEG